VRITETGGARTLSRADTSTDEVGRDPSWKEPRVTSSADGVSLLTLVREDLERHGREWSSPGFQALAVYRFGRFARTRPGLGGKVLRRLHHALFVFVRNVYGIELHADTVIGRRMHMGHQHGVVIHPKTVFGDDCVLRHNVTIGVGIAGKRSDEAPHFGDRVKFGPGAVVLGGVRVGDDVRIGPNTLIMSDVPSGAHVLEKPTRVLRLHRGEGGSGDRAEGIGQAMPASAPTSTSAPASAESGGA
jgi:serine O-acetyltransferase